jgi:hypothetical protein
VRGGGRGTVFDRCLTSGQNVFDRRYTITSGYRIVEEAPILRHFTVKLEPIGERPV